MADDDKFSPRISIELLYELGQITEDYNTWDKIDDELALGEDGHKVVRGMKKGRRSKYPDNFERSTYFDALDAVVVSYKDTMEALAIIRRCLGRAGLCIPEVDALFARIDQTDVKARTDMALTWWDELEGLLIAHFVKADEDSSAVRGDMARRAGRSQGAAPADRAAEDGAAVAPGSDSLVVADAQAMAAGTAAATAAGTAAGPEAAPDAAPDAVPEVSSFAPSSTVPTPTVLRLVKAVVTGEVVAGLSWVAALDRLAGRGPRPAAAKDRPAPRRPVVYGRPLSDEEFVRRAFPRDFLSAFGGRFADATAFLDADPRADGAAWDYWEFFSGDRGLHASRLAGCCQTLMAHADAGEFFARAEELLDALEDAGPGDATSGGAGLGDATSDGADDAGSGLGGAGDELPGGESPGSAPPRDEGMHLVRSLFVRFAAGDAGRGLAFVVLVALIGPDFHALDAIVRQPEVRWR